MARPPKKHSYAAQLTTEAGYKISNGEKTILKQPNTIHETTPQDPHITISSAQKERARTITKITYEQLLNLGFSIIQKRLKYKVAGKYAAYHYIIVPETSTTNSIEYLPENHEIQHDEQFCAVRLIGKNAGTTGYGKWKKYVIRTQTKRTINDVRARAEEIRRRRRPRTYEEETTIKIPITELMISQNVEKGEIYCIQKKDETITVCISGKRGQGKTLTTNAITGRIFHTQNIFPIIINDWQKECGHWSLPWETQNEFHTQIQLLGEHTTPLPAVYFHLEGNPKLKRILLEKEVGFKISMPFKEWFLDFENILVKKGWKMDKMLPRIRNAVLSSNGKNLKEEIKNCATIPEITKFIEEEMIKQAEEAGAKDGKASVWMMLEKIKAVFADINSKNFLDISNGIPHYWTVKNTKTGEIKKFPPWIAAIYCGIVPVFETGYYYKESYFPEVVKYIIESVFEYKRGKLDSCFKERKTKIVFVIDELPEIADSKKPTAANSAIESIAASGRMLGIGIVYTTQNYSRTPERLKTNTKYMISFRQGSKKEAKEISDNFDLEKRWIGEMMGLQKFECVLIPDNTPIIVYNTSDGTRTETDQPVKGILIPPLNQHQPPE